MDLYSLDLLFQKYGYEVKEKNEHYHVYLLNQGMYHGAEIQILDETESTKVIDRYSRLGYHAKKQKFHSIEEAENYLFKGFFNTQTTKSDILKRYDDFANNQVRVYCNPQIKYTYINMPYTVYADDTEEGSNGTVDIVSAINNEIRKTGARLIIVEAAAGFGKSCTAYEVYKSFINYTDTQKPIFTELYNNRNAKLFKYVLWSEIDKEKDTTAKQDLVVYNIKRGKIPLIIDGFDELLSKDIDPGQTEHLSEFEQVETMLSTIGELLSENAKIVLTSRKTAIFAGTEFDDWVNSYDGSFDVVRFQLDKPNIKEWLTQNRFEELSRNNIPLSSISNPVLLTYIRNIDDKAFNEILSCPDYLTDKYFEHLLNREKERQNLTIRWEDQMAIFENLAKAFAEFDIMGDTRSFVKELIIDYNKSNLLVYKENMPTKQTLDELADTLTNHALLDRIGNKDFITFVNEFVMGYLLGKAIIKNHTNFLNNTNTIPEYLIELAISASKYSSKSDKIKLWNKLHLLKDKMSLALAISTDSVLLNEVHGTFEYEGFNSYHFENVSFINNNCYFTEDSFIDIIFDNCTFERKAFYNVTFTGCKFIDCKLIDDEEHNASSIIRCFGCDDFNNGFISVFSSKNRQVHDENNINEADLEKQILGKYIKVDGKSRKMKYISSLRKEFENQDVDLVFAVFERLKKEGKIITDGNNSHITKAGIMYYHK